MKYTDKSFSVAAPGTDEYRENYDRIFTKRASDTCKCGKYRLYVDAGFVRAGVAHTREDCGELRLRTHGEL